MGLPRFQVPNGEQTSGTQHKRARLEGFGKHPSLFRARRIGAAALLLGSGVLCGYTAVQLLGSPQAEAAAPIEPLVIERETTAEMVSVLVPLKPIEKGKPIEPELLGYVKRPAFTVNENMVRDFSQVQGLFARTLIPSQQPLSLELLTTERPTNEVIERIPAGYRAIAISVNETSGVEGWARAGAYVDVHWISELNGEKAAALIVENARVLSAERRLETNVDPNAPIPTTVTLLASERDAQRIGLASTDGSLVLHLRGMRDSGKASGNVGVLSARELLTGGGQEAGTTPFEGTVKIQGADGTMQEWVVVGGKLVPRPLDR